MLRVVVLSRWGRWFFKAGDFPKINAKEPGEILRVTVQGSGPKEFPNGDHDDFTSISIRLRTPLRPP